jgi:hypothetical protein
MTGTRMTNGHTPAFRGFEPPTANFIYCPNQFFDLCLPHYSRNVVRLVAHLLYKTLGWLDKNGNPIEQNISVSYGDLITEAGISRGAIRRTIDDAVAAGLIVCTQQGLAKDRGQAGQTGRYMLRWDSGTRYLADPRTFQGFYAGEGHRTPIPNAFFGHVVRWERLAVVKVVGTVLRHTVGYANQFGTGRRTHAPLSYSYIQQYARMRDRTTLSDAIHHAINVGYVRCVSKGTFHSRPGNRRAATYSVNWLHEGTSQQFGTKTPPVATDRYKNPTSNGSENRPVDPFKNPTKEKTDRNNTFKQQDMRPAAVVVDCEKAYDLLIDAGFDRQTAVRLSQSRGIKELEQQIDWLPKRSPDRNPLGMLRRAIEENWTAPVAVVVEEKKNEARQKDKESQERQAADDKAAAARKRQRREFRQTMLSQWYKLSAAEQRTHHQTAIENANSDFLQNRLRRHSDLNDPPTETLENMARALALPIGEAAQN